MTVPSVLRPRVLWVSIYLWPIHFFCQLCIWYRCVNTNVFDKFINKNDTPTLCVSSIRISIYLLQAVGTEGTVFLSRILLIPYDYQFQLKQLQFPVKVCFDITIKKTQKQSLKMARVDLKDDCFLHGQLTYVTICSRVALLITCKYCCLKVEPKHFF